MPSTADRLARLLAEIAETKARLHALLADYHRLERSVCEEPDRPADLREIPPLAKGVH